MSVIVVNHITLDGVIQGPGRPDEDTRDGFRHGGWAAGADDPELAAALGETLGTGFSWLFGRRSYEGMLSHWNAEGGPFKDGLNETVKHVATSHPDADLPWPNSVPVTGDVPERIRELSRDTRLVIMGSGELIRSLVPHRLVDELLLFVHPVSLGSGRRMFGDTEEMQRWAIVSSASTASGVLVTRYRAA